MINTKDMIFVFGSNIKGIHGAGAAAYARKHKGAILGIGEGPQGMSYALPTMGLGLGPKKGFEKLHTGNIKFYVDRFTEYAMFRPDLKFQVTQVGCGLGGHKKEDIAPLFKMAPINCYFDEAWESILGDEFEYWGTF